MDILTCKNMRSLVILSISVLIVGSLLIFAASSFPQGILPSLTVYTGFFLLLSSPLLIAGTLLMTFLPGAERQMWNCGH